MDPRRAIFYRGIALARVISPRRDSAKSSLCGCSRPSHIILAMIHILRVLLIALLALAPGLEAVRCADCCSSRASRCAMGAESPEHRCCAESPLESTGYGVVIAEEATRSVSEVSTTWCVCWPVQPRTIPASSELAPADPHVTSVAVVTIAEIREFHDPLQSRGEFSRVSRRVPKIVCLRC